MPVSFPFGCRAQVALAAAGLSLTSSASASGISLDDITTWTGSGANRAGLVIDWADGSEPAVYGYRFDGGVTGEDMFRAIAMDRPELFLKTGAFSFPSFSRRAIFGVGLDRDNDGFAISDATVFTDGIAEVSTTQADGATADDTDDSYVEGWNSGFWGYYNAAQGDAWGFAPVGFTDRLVVDGQWDGWSFQPGFAGDVPSINVPEPGSAAVLGICAIALIRRRR